MGSDTSTRHDPIDARLASPTVTARSSNDGEPASAQEQARLHRAELALAASEERFRILFETMTQGIVYQDAAGVIVVANPAAEAILGLSFDQMQGRTSIDPRWRAVREDGSDFPGDQHPAIQALHTGKAVRDVVMGVYHPARQAYRWILVSAVPDFGEGSRPAGVHTTFTDITERKEAEAALRASEARFRRVAESAPVLIFRYEIEPRRQLTYINAAATTITGYTPAEHYADADLGFKLIHPEDRARLDALAADLARSQAPSTLRWIRKDGQTIWIEQRNVPIFDELGNLVAVEGLAFDVTARIQMEMALDASHTRLNLALDTAKAGVWEWEIATNEAVWSAENFRLLGMDPKEDTATYAGWLNAVHPDDREAAVAATAHAVATRQELDIDFRVVWPDGTVRWLNDRGRLLFDEAGRPQRMVGIQIDITESRRAADALHDQLSFLQSLLSAFPNPVFYKDREGRYLGCNQAFSTFIGVSPEELPGRTVDDLFSPALAAAYRAADDALLTREFTQDGSFAHFLGSGT